MSTALPVAKTYRLPEVTIELFVGGELRSSLFEGLNFRQYQHPKVRKTVQILLSRLSLTAFFSVNDFF
jgi:hypothetical protein